MGILMPPYSAKGGILHSGCTACPGTTTALENMVVPAQSAKVVSVTQMYHARHLLFSAGSLYGMLLGSKLHNPYAASCGVYSAYSIVR